MLYKRDTSGEYDPKTSSLLGGYEDEKGGESSSDFTDVAGEKAFLADLVLCGMAVTGRLVVVVAMVGVEVVVLEVLEVVVVVVLVVVVVVVLVVVVEVVGSEVVEVEELFPVIVLSILIS